MKIKMRGMFDPLVEQTIKMQEVVCSEYHLHDHESIIHGVEELTPMLDCGGNANRGRLYNLLAFASIGKGDMHAASEAVIQAKKVNLEIGSVQAFSVSCFFEAAILAAKGELKAALEVLGCTDEAAQAPDEKRPAGLMNFFCICYRLQLLYELGQYGAARQWLDQYQRVRNPSPVALSTYLLGVMDSRLACIENGPQAATLILQKLAGRLSHDQAIQEKIGFEMARIAITTGDTAQAGIVLAKTPTERRINPAPIFIHPSDEIEGAGIETIRLMLHAGGDYYTEGMQILATQIAEAAAADRKWRLTKLYILNALGFLLAGNTDCARNKLVKAVQLAVSCGVTSSFLDEGQILTDFMVSLLQSQSCALTEAEQQHINLVLAARGQITNNNPGVQLNNREMEILKLVAEGLTSGTIAGRLELSLQTIKWYLKGIYAKLAVGNRAGAVEKAHRLGLI